MANMKPISAMEHMMLNIEKALKFRAEVDHEADNERKLLANVPTNVVQLP